MTPVTSPCDRSGCRYLWEGDGRADDEGAVDAPGPPEATVGAAQQVLVHLLGDAEATRDHHTGTVEAQDGVGQHQVPGVRDTPSCTCETIDTPTTPRPRPRPLLLLTVKGNKIKLCPQICKIGNPDLA